MKKILVPIDYSDNSRNALIYGLEIARKASAELILLHAFYPIMAPPAAHSATDVILALEEGKNKELLAFSEEVLGTLPIANKSAAAVPVKAVARMGGSYEKVLEAITNYSIDLVVMGMQGGNAVSQALLGSTTISVMQQSPVPVLAVPKGIAYNPFEIIVFATNLAKLSAGTNLGFLGSFVNIFNAELQVLHLYQNETQHQNFDATLPLQHITGQLRQVPYSIHFDVQENVAQGIQQFIQKQQADLLVLIPQKHTLLERLLDKSITGRITANPQVPLLALPVAEVQPTVVEPIKQLRPVAL